MGLPWWLSGKEPAFQCKRHLFNPWVSKTPWRRTWQPTPLFLLENPMARGAWRATNHRAAKAAPGSVTKQHECNNRMLFRTSTDSVVLLLTITQHIYILSCFGMAYIHSTPTSPLSYHDELQTHKGSPILSNQNIVFIALFPFPFFIKAPEI